MKILALLSISRAKIFKLRNMKNLFLIFLILKLTSCNHAKLGESTIDVNEDTTLFHSKFSNSDEGASFECDSFASNALNKYTVAIINQKFSSILNYSKESVVNRHDSAVTDTIYTFSKPENIIQIYRAKHDDFIFTFDVTDSLFKLKGNVRTGMTKENFSRKFRITKTIKNKVQIVNSDGTSKFMFYFENNRLKRINSYLYLD